METVYISSATTSIGTNAFSNCPKLEKIEIGDGSKFYEDENGVLYDAGKTILIKYPPAILLTSYDIPEGVVSITAAAFRDAKNLTKVTMPDSLRTIGANAFYGCTALAEISLGEGVTTINSGAFYGCAALTSVTFPKSLTSIANGGAASGAFRGCNNLTKVTFEDSAATIGNYTFYNLTGLTEVDLGNQIKSIGNSAFRGCTLSDPSFTIPGSVTSIGSHAFRNCIGLTALAFPAGLTSIGGSAFYGCTGLTNIVFNNCATDIGASAFYGCTKLAGADFGDRIKTIGNSAFYSTALVTATIPATVTGIGTNVFYNCPRLERIDIDEENMNYISINGILFNKAITTLIKYPANHIGSSFGIPDGVNSISDNAFRDAKNLTKVTLPDSLRTIGANAFYGCTVLAEISLGAGVTTINQGAFYGCAALTSVTFPKSLASIVNGGAASGAFRGCTNLTKVTFEDSAATIGNYAFYNLARLAEVDFGSEIKAIGGNAFRGCSALTTLTIPTTVTNIGNYAFYGCTGLMNVVFDNCVVDIGTHAFYGCTKLAGVDLGNSVKTIGNNAFYNNTSLITVTIPASVTSIGTNAFYNCASLERIDIDEDNPSYFSADGVLLDKSITTLIKYPASHMGSSFDIPDGVISISDNAFRDAKKLEKVTMPDSLMTIGANAFYGCSLTSITIPGSVSSIGTAAFRSCTVLAKVVLEEGVQTIGNNAFASCRNLTRIEIPYSVNSISNNTFNSSSNVVIYTWPGSYAEEYGIARGIPVRNIMGDPVLAKIEVTTPPTKTVYVVGDTLNLGGMVVAAKYDDESTEEIEGYTTSPAAGTALNTIGTRTVTVSYTEDGITKTTTFTVTVNPKLGVLDKIDITTLPAKRAYIVGDTLNLGGLVVTATYDDGRTEEIEGYTTSPAAGTVLSAVGIQTITASYTETGITKTTTFTVTVRLVPVVLAKIEVTTPPTKTVYVVGDTLNLGGMVVTATYDDESTEGVAGYTTNPAAGTVLDTVGTQTVAVSYTEGEVTKTTTFTVTVRLVPAVLDKIEVTTPPTKTVYVVGDTLNLGGMVVTATYDDESKVGVAGYTTNPAAGTALSTAGTQTVTVSYTESDTTKTTTFSVTVNSGGSGNGSGGSGTTTTNYTVTFNSNSGSAVDSRTVTANTKVAKPADPTKEGFTFAGWFTDVGLTTAYNFDALVTGSFTLYAKWIEDEKSSEGESDRFPLTDVASSAWFYEHIKYVYDLGLMNGTGPTLFSPNMPVTRGMLVTVLYRMEDEPKMDKYSSFGDVPSGTWYTNAVAWAEANNIVEGYPGGIYRPEQNVSRQELATVLLRYAKLIGKNQLFAGYNPDDGTGNSVLGDSNEEIPDIVPTTVVISDDLDFVDADKIGDWAMAGVTFCVENKIIEGRPGNIFDPTALATRGEFAAVLHRFLEKIK